MVKRLIFMAALLLMPVNIFAQEIFKSITFDEACLVAEKEHKTIIIDFYTTWCGPCKQLDKTTWQDKNVIKFLTDNAIALKVDAEVQVDLANKFHVQAYPTILFVKPDGNEMDRIVGYLEASQFLDTAKSTITGKSILTHSKEALEQDKNNPKLRLAYIDALLTKDLNKEALEQYKILIPNNKDNLEIRMGYIDLLFKENQSEEALAEYRNLINENNNDPYKPYQRMAYAKKLAQVGQYRESLNEYMYCYDHGVEESMYFEGMRNYALLGDIMMLANKYPPAKQALINRRDLLQQAVLNSKATMEQVTGYICLNNSLQDTANTLEVFDKVKSQPQVRKVLFREVMDTLLQAKRYNDVLTMAPDPLIEVKSNIKTGDGYIEIIKNDPNMDKELVDGNLYSTRMEVINLNSSYYEAALGTNNLTLASQIADSLIDFYNNIETYKVLIERAKHVNAVQQVTELKERADKYLP